MIEESIIILSIKCFKLIEQNVLMKTALNPDKRDISHLAHDTRYE